MHTYTHSASVCAVQGALNEGRTGPFVKTPATRKLGEGGEKGLKVEEWVSVENVSSKMGTFLFQQFPHLAFPSQWPIQQQVMPWHIQMRPLLTGRADWLDNETQHGDKPGQTG